MLVQTGPWPVKPPSKPVPFPQGSVSYLLASLGGELCHLLPYSKERNAGGVGQLHHAGWG